MKKQLLLSLALAPAMCMAQAFSDDFESYTAGSYIAENSNGLWTTWSNAPGGAEDAYASDDFAHSGSISAEFESAAADGGPTDFVHDFGNLTSGHYLLTLWILVVDGSGGYFNLLHTGGNQAVWALGAYFDGNGEGHIQAGGVQYPFNHTLSGWNEVKVDIDMDADQCRFFMNGASVASWQWSYSEFNTTEGSNQLAWMDVFAYGGEDWLAHYYIDDVSFQEVVIDGAADLYRNGEMPAWPNPVRDMLHVDMRGATSAGTHVELVDLTGKVLAVPTRQEGQVLHMDMGSLMDGVYFVRATDGDMQRVGRVVKR
ncbi:MAG TPA: T9SS type A sorting domain-containing protein [Flavobacteriales bacterium]|nr:T9SS type A sorting domain-containing protein [Flavobacteriales bacterium]HRO39764.1 T9SS type A sorting domain-containing protein [Flavobacteriales bacterium]HRP80342.1 T9SS type A sorting domain-containing protein [Flavobacteriales bacterium]HRQ83517.1 T9SS type A sorting domain-containing protein [Flavobacteriales bacterium]